MITSMKAIIIIFVVAVLGGVAYALTHNGAPAATTPTNNSSTSGTTGASDSSSASDTTSAVSATITLDDNGFSPSVITVKSGDSIRITNSSSQPLQLDSDPHPEHTDDEELNVGTVSPGQSKTFVLKTKGTWGYHDHLSPGFTGTIHVE